MSEKEAPTPAAKDEVDPVRAILYFLGILLVGLGVVVWVLFSRRDRLAAAAALGERELGNLAKDYQKIQARLTTYKESGAGEARSHTVTWISKRAEAAGIEQKQVADISKWQERQGRDPVKNETYYEEYVHVKIKGVPREKAVQFVWNVERMSTKMRSLLMVLNRTPSKDQGPEADVWDLDVDFGYRVSRRPEG